MEKVNFDEKYRNKKSNSNTFYHYTSPEAFLNICQDHSIRFTDCMFMNDAQEYNYIVELLDKLSKTINDAEIKSFLEKLSYAIDKTNNDYAIVYDKKNKKSIFSKAKYYVLSGTTNKDSLPMWCYYSKDSGYYGYAIQFDSEGLIKNFDNNSKVICGRVVYDEEEQLEILNREISLMFQRFHDEYNKVISDEPSDMAEILGEELQEEFYELIQEIRLFFKNPGFKHEAEYRIVVKKVIDFEEPIKQHYACIKGIIKPYIEVEFSKDMSDGVIKSIILSPSIEENAGKTGVIELMTTCFTNFNLRKYKDFVSHSKLELRF